MAINSPANQHTNDEREQKCWDLYVKSIENGTPNALQSALDAGYSPDHSRNITLQGWFKERSDRLRRKDMLSKAERNLNKVLEMHTLDEKGNEDPNLLRIQVDVSKTIVTTLGKADYSTKTETELYNPDGNLKTIVINKYASGDKPVA